MPADLTNASIPQLIAALDHPTLTRRTIAAGLLVDKFGKQAADAVREAFGKSMTGQQRSHLLWVLVRLGAFDETIIASAAGDKSREVRIHAVKVLAEIPRWSDGQRTLALAGLSDTDAFVRRAAADALGQHPQFENIRLLLDTLETVPEEDSHLRYTIRMALRNQLRADKVFAAVLKTKLNETDAKTLAGVAVAVKSQAAGSFLLNHVENHREQPATVSTYLRHAARYIPAGETDRLAEFVRGRFRNNIDFQLTLLTSINTGLEQRGLPAGGKIKAWGAGLAAQLLDSLDADSLQWGNTPLPDKLPRGNPWVLQKRVSADGNRDGLFLCSLPRGERLTGILRSADFEIPETLSFYLAGHIGFPKQPVIAKNFVRLRDTRTHELLAESKPPRHDTARKMEWDLKRHAGKRGYLEIVDGDERRAFAWLAVGRFQPPVVALPRLSPSLAAQRQTSAADIAAQLKLKDLQPRLARLVVVSNGDTAARAAIAAALLAIHPDGRLAALVPAIGSPSIAADLRNRIGRSFVDRNTTDVAKLLSEVMQSSPQRQQGRMAEILAGDKTAAGTLLKLVKEGHASARLLQRQAVRTKLLAVKLRNIEKRLAELTAGIPSENELLRKLILERRTAFANAKVSLENGAKLFTKNCAACHQLDGKGPLVGPQLDGIGGRGVERIIEDIIDPNRNVDVAFRSTNYVLESGMVKTGLFRRIDGATLVVADNKGKEFTIRKDEIAQEFKTNISLMPEDLPKAMTPTEFYDLVAFLAAKKKMKSEK